MSASESRSGIVAAVRGATGVAGNTSEAILEATTQLLRALMERNRLAREQLVSVLFTATPDLNADFPAHAARRLGWTDVPLLGAREVDVPGAPVAIVRVLMTVRDAPSSRLEPVYLGAARQLRPDLVGDPAPARAAEGRARRIAIIGLGQIGGSIGLALGAAGGWRRIGHDADTSVARAASAAGAVDDVAPTLEAACEQAEVAVLALPVDVLADAIDRAALALPRGAVLMDTGSTRHGVTPALERAAARGLAAVGGHPIAGREGHGFGASSADLFQGASFALFPIGGEAHETALRLVADLGARAVVCKPDEHDHALARTSHLPYLVACALADTGREAAQRALSGPGFRDMTRLAASDPRVAGAYVRANAREVREAWEELRAAIDRRVHESGA